jgi:hypothetical protein
MFSAPFPALPVDALRIDAADADDLAFWACILDVGVDEVRQAVRRVGDGVADVQRYFGWVDGVYGRTRQ